MQPSNRFTLSKEDIIAWLKNSAIFFAPFALVFLLALQQGSDLKDALNILKLYGLNVVIDILRKFVGGTSK